MIDSAENAPLQAIFATAVSPIITINSCGIIQTVNAATIKLFGYGENELMGQNVNILLPEPHRSHHDQYLAAYLTTNIKKIIGKGRELEAQRKDGQKIPIHLAVSEYKEGEDLFFVGIITDLSATHHARAKTTAIIKAAVAPVITIDETGRIESINDATCQMFGYHHDELIGKNVKILAPSPHRAHHDQYLSSYRHSGVAKIIGTGRELTAIDKNGKLIPIHLSVSEFHVDQHRYFVGIITDLSAVRKAEAQLRTLNAQLAENNDLQKGKVKLYELLSSEDNLSSIAQAISQLFSEKLSLTVCQIFICREQEKQVDVLGETFSSDRQALEKLSTCDALIAKTFSTERKCYQENKGSQAHESIHRYLFPLHGSHNILGIVHACGSAKLSEQKMDFIESAVEAISLRFQVRLNEQRVRSLLQQTQRQAEEMEQANRYKSEFLANMSHELRTPLNAIMMLSQSMEENRLNNLQTKQVQHLRTIHTAGQDLLTLINDILDLAKVEAGKLEVIFEPIDIEPWIENLYLLIEPLAKKKNLDFRIHIDNSMPKQLISDKIKLEQILRNLLANAIKFTEQGQIIVKLGKQEETIFFRVEDSGVGIAVNKQKEIFEAFVQIDGKTTRQFRGTGLGLSIAKELTSLLGGSITVSSKLGQGSIFTLQLPDTPLGSANRPQDAKPLVNNPSTDDHAPSSRPHLWQGKTILVVDDDERNRSSIEVALAKTAATLIFAKNGQEALAHVASQEQNFNLVLMDMMMPAMDGVTATALIKQRKPKLPIIAMTASATTKDRQKCIEAGCDDYMAKPLDCEILLAMLKMWLNK